MKHNLLQQYQSNVNKAVFATHAAYESFSNRIKNRYNLDTKADSDPELDSMADNCPDDSAICGNIGIIDFKGFTVNTCSELEEICCGCISLQGFQEDLKELVANPLISKVIINFDSGGGYTMGLEETAAVIAELTTKKDIYAYTSGFLCSAAYYLAAYCTNIIASPSSQVGSIGCYCEYLDLTKQLAEEGIEVKTFQGGTKKTIGSPYLSLTPEQEKEIQSEVDRMYEDFKGAMISARGSIPEEVMQGQSYSGKDALALGTNLIDGNLNSLEDMVKAVSQITTH